MRFCGWPVTTEMPDFVIARDSFDDAGQAGNIERKNLLFKGKACSGLHLGNSSEHAGFSLELLSMVDGSDNRHARPNSVSRRRNPASLPG